MKIAFCLNNEDKIKSINDWTVIKIYEYNGTVARKVQEIFSNESNLRSIKEKQNFAKKAISSLGDCKMLAASNISGVFLPPWNAQDLKCGKSKEISMTY